MRTYEAFEIARGNPQILDRLVNEASQKLTASDTLSHTRNGGAAAQLYDDPVENRRVLLEDARAMVARADTETRRFLTGFADVIRTLQAIDGRKTVILFSEGFHIDNVTHELEDVAAAAAQSYSAIYAMDLNVRSVEADATALPFEPGSFDVVCSARTFHHVPRPELVLAEMNRVLRPGGTMLVVDQLAPVDPLAAIELNRFEHARDPSTTRILADVDLRGLFDSNTLVLQRAEVVTEQLELKLE